MRKDYKVLFRTEESIKAVAERFRDGLGLRINTAFNVAACIKRMVDEPVLTSGRLKLELYTQVGQEPFAYVTFLPTRTLHVDQELWVEAQEYNEPEIRYVLEHEIGHLILHNHHTQGFSGEKSKAWLNEESSEWQADRFADYSLVTDAELERYRTPRTIASYCAVTREVALRRLGPKFKYSGDPCPGCGNFTLTQSDSFLWCDTCQCL